MSTTGTEVPSSNGAVMCSYKIDGGGNQSGKKLAELLGYDFFNLHTDEWKSCKAKNQIWYMNDDIYTLRKHPEFTEVLSFASDIKVVLNFVIGGAHKAKWMVDYPVTKVLFLNRQREVEWMTATNNTRHGLIDTAVLCPPINMERFQNINKPINDKLVISRHSRISLKYTGEPMKLYKEINKPTREFRFMLAHPSIKRFSNENDNFKCYTWNEIPVEKYLEDTDIWLCIINPRTKEQGPRTLAEAMLAGCVCIVENRDGPTDKIINGVTGFLIDSEDEVPALLDKLEADPELRKKIGQAARDYAINTFNPENWVRELKQINI